VAFENSLQSEEARQQWKTLRDSLDAYNLIRDGIIEDAMAGRNEEALAKLEDGAVHADTVSEQLDKLFDNKKTNGESLSIQISDSADRTIYTMVIVVVAAIIAAILLGIFISRMISRPVKKLVAAAEQIADGDLGVRVDVETRDEIGQLGSSFRIMTDN